jgi:hypothetical protein
MTEVRWNISRPLKKVCPCKSSRLSIGFLNNPLILLFPSYMQSQNLINMGKKQKLEYSQYPYETSMTLIPILGLGAQYLSLKSGPGTC